jgi:hypothetical protein
MISKHSVFNNTSHKHYTLYSLNISLDSLQSRVEHENRSP